MKWEWKDGRYLVGFLVAKKSFRRGTPKSERVCTRSFLPRCASLRSLPSVVDTKVDSSFDWNEIRGSLCNDEGNQAGQGGKVQDSSTDDFRPSLIRKKNKRQLVSGSIEQLGLKAAHGFLRDQYLQVDGEWWWLGRLDDVRFFGRGWRGFLPGWQRQSFRFLHQSSITATLAMKPPTTSWSPKECLFLVWVAGPTVFFLKMFFW